MEPLQAAGWEIILPAILCLAEAAPTGTVITEGRTEEKKATFPASISGEASATKTTPLPCIIDTNVTYTVTTISKGYTISFAATVIVPDKNIVKAGGCSAINFQIPLPISGATITIVRNTTTEGTISGGAFSSNLPTLGAFSSAFENTTENAPPNIINTVSAKTPSTIYTATVAPKSATTQNGDLAINLLSLLQDSSSDQEDVTTGEMPETENTLDTITKKTNSSDHEDVTTNAMTTDPGNTTPTLKEPSADTQENSAACYLDCDIFPAWATVLLCLATTFLLFILVGLLFLVPYCAKFRHPPAMPYNSSPRYSA